MQQSSAGTAPTSADWSGAMSAAFYYGVPTLYTVIIVVLIAFGSAWLETVTSGMGWLFSLINGGSDAEISTRVVYGFAVLSIFVSASRLAAAIKIPPEATLGQNVDRVISIVPVIVMLVLGTYAYAEEWPIDRTSWMCLNIAFWSVLLLDFWIGGLAQKLVAAYRRRLDVV